ncbi:MAG: hypothetical protein R3C59_05540 [Planctomycetaceae bacterium]
MATDPYLQVLSTYWNRRLLLAVLVTFWIVSLLPPAIFWIVAKTQPPEAAMFSVFLAFPMMFVGAHVKQQLASPEASLVPGFRPPHLIVAASFFLLPIVQGVLVAGMTGGSAAGYVSLLLFICLMFFHVSAHSSPMSGLAVIGMYLSMLIPPLRLAVEQLMAGELPGLAWSLLSAEAAIGVLLFHRLATLTEDDPSYGNVMPMNVWDMRAAEVRRRNRAQLQKTPRVFLSLIDTESRRLEKRTTKPAETRSQRVALLQMANDWPVSPRFMMALILVLEGGPLLISQWEYTSIQITTAAGFAQALSWPIMLSLTFAWTYWFGQSQRWSRLGYESLRPTTRQDWVLDNGLAAISNMLRLQAVWLLVQVVLLLIFLPTWAGSVAIVNGLVFLIGLHVLMFGIGAWLSSFGSMFWKLMIFSGAMGGLQPAWLGVSRYASGLTWHIPVVAVTSAVVGLLLTQVAYRRWCRIDLM